MLCKCGLDYDEELIPATCGRCGSPLSPIPGWLKDRLGNPARCAACDRPVTDDPKVPRVLYFQSWCKAIFCEECWGFGNARWFPGARKLLDKLVAIGFIVPEYWPADLQAMLAEVPK
jgi:hypothetical protein